MYVDDKVKDERIGENIPCKTPYNYFGGYTVRRDSNYPDPIKPTIVDPILSMLLLALGEFAGLEEYAEAPDGIEKTTAFFMFFLACFLILIMFMNMLIQVMSIPFDYVESNRVKEINK